MSDSDDLPPKTSRQHYLNAASGWKSWLFTLDHKRVALLYLVSFAGLCLLGELSLWLPRPFLPSVSGPIDRPMTGNPVFSVHGVVMVSSFLIPAIPSALANFLIPLMIGARNLAFPKLSLFTWYLFVLGGLFSSGALISGRMDPGWTFQGFSKWDYGAVSLALAGIMLVGLSSILTGFNFVVTIHKRRAPGLTWLRLPSFVWTHYVAGIIQILYLPFVAITLAALALDRMVRIGIFNPALGGDPLLLEHIFWFHQELAVVFLGLPALGVVVEITRCFAQRSVQQSRPPAPMFCVLGCAAFLAIAWLAVLFVAASTTDPSHLAAYAVRVCLNDLAVGAAMIAYLGGVHYWWPKITGRMYPERWGQVAVLLLFLGVDLALIPPIVSSNPLAALRTAGFAMVGAGYILPLCYLLRSLRDGAVAGPNPWRATALEWQTSSPPPTCNFERTPVVVHGPYGYDSDAAGHRGPENG